MLTTVVCNSDYVRRDGCYEGKEGVSKLIKVIQCCIVSGRKTRDLTGKTSKLTKMKVRIEDHVIASYPRPQTVTCSSTAATGKHDLTFAAASDS